MYNRDDEMRGQGSIEIMLVAIIILAVGVYLFWFYIDQSSQSVALAVVREDVDQAISFARLDGCNASVANISISGNNITVNIEKCNATKYINTARILEDIYQALGCQRGVEACKGRSYTIAVKYH